jgi:hypothetical protein
MASSVFHLAKRAWTSFDNRPILFQHVEKAERILNPDEFELWWKMEPRDQAHSIVVLERFLKIIPYAKREEQAAALLHDIGKICAPLNWGMRIVATIVGPRGEKFRAYHNHESLGLELLASVSAERTLAVLTGTAESLYIEALRAADNI